MVYLAVWRAALMNWSMYNDSLVRRGEVLLDFSVLEGVIGWNGGWMRL